MKTVPRDLLAMRAWLEETTEPAPGSLSPASADLWWLSADACRFLVSIMSAPEPPPVPPWRGSSTPLLVGFAESIPLGGGTHPSMGVLLQVSAGASHNIMDAREQPIRDEAEDGELDVLADAVGWLVRNPELIERREVDASPSRPSKAARRRGAQHQPSPVTIVDLRAPVKKARAEVAEAERTYRHRWIVRGHWHTYCTGKGRTERRVVYVMPYVKGPADAPLNPTELVRKL